MSVKQVLFLVIFLSTTFLAMMGGLLYLYKAQPELLGLPKKDGTKDSTVVIPTRADTLEQKVKILVRDTVRLRADVDSLKSLLAMMTDSVQRTTVAAADIRGVLAKRDSLARQQELLMAASRDSIMNDTYDSFARLYNTVAPAEVAKILEKLDDRDAALILRRMKQKNAAKVVEAMDPDKAASVLVLGSMSL